MKRILLLSMVFSFVFALSAMAQRTVSGKVTDENGEGLPGVNVVIKGTTTGVTTDLDGNYQISVPDDNTVLVFSSVGMASQEVVVGARTVIDLGMAADTKQLQEVVVTGYGVVEARRASGSVARVGAATINDVPLASFDKILQGQAAGVLSQGASGQPGAGASVLIRGASSINSGTQPLYVMDGVPIDAAEFETLNPSDIADVSILKDASASSIFGSRGANGVIVITTKRGSAGKPVVKFSAQYGVSETPGGFLPVMNTQQKIQYERLTGTNSSRTEEEWEALAQIETDWFDELFKPGKTQNYQLSVSGGNENTTYFVSGSVYDEEGSFINTGLQRYTTRFNLTTVHNRVTFGLNTTLGYSKLQDTPEGNASIVSPLNAAYWTNPYETVYDENGDFTVVESGQPNGVQELTQNYNNTENVKVVSSMYLEYDLPWLEGLSFRTSGGLDYDADSDINFSDPRTNSGGQARGGQGGLNRGSVRDVTLITTNSLTYTNQFGTDHRLTTSLFQEFIWSEFESFGFTGYGFTNIKLRNEAGISAGSGTNGFIPQVGGGGVQSALSSVFGTLAYTFKDRYTFNATIRRDGSSRFGANNRWATFYSIGGVWNISEESFFGLDFINDLKFVSSYGTVGNQEIGDYQFSSNLATSSYNGQNGLVLTSIPNADLKWETVKMFNAGIQFAALNNRLTGQVDYYNNLTVDAFLGTQLSLTTGFASQSQNAAEVRNSGVEVTLNASVIDQGDFSFRVGGNFSFNKNIVESLAGEDDLIGATNIITVGKPINSNYVVEYVGVNPANGDALYRTIDGQITSTFNQARDSRIYGPRTAPYSGGVTLNVDYRGFSLFVLGSWISGSTLYNNERINIDNPAYRADNLSVDMLRAWQEPGDITDVPRVATVNGLTTSTYQSSTTRYLEDGDFFRLRNVVLAYKLPSGLIEKAGFGSVRIYAQGQNLLTLTKFTGADPEDTNGFLLGAVYPAVRTYTFGLDITF